LAELEPDGDDAPDPSSARDTPARTINRPINTRRLKNPPSPTSLRANLRRVERLWRAGADTEILRVLATRCRS